MIGLLVALLVFVVVFLIVRSIVPLFGLDANAQRIVYLIIGLIFLLWLIGLLTGYAPVFGVRSRLY